MNILVFGATGGLGRNVVQHLLEHMYHVRALIQRPETSAIPATNRCAESVIRAKR
jgi:uncharacterized protein YbjT (DUF2867 family)